MRLYDEPLAPLGAPRTLSKSIELLAFGKIDLNSAREWRALFPFLSSATARPNCS